MTDLKSLLEQCRAFVVTEGDNHLYGVQTTLGNARKEDLLSKLDSAIAGMKVVEVEVQGEHSTMVTEDGDEVRSDYFVVVSAECCSSPMDEVDAREFARSLDGAVLRIPPDLHDKEKP